MPVETISWKDGKIRYIDQTLLPHKVKYVNCRDIKTLWNAIKVLKVRGAPAIGIAGALGVALGIKNSRSKTSAGLIKEVDEIVKYLASSRPTAVNLFWALKRMQNTAKASAHRTVRDIKAILIKEAIAMVREDKAVCRRMAAFGANLIKSGDRILTHCNAGGLATADYGTALGVLFESKTRGRRIKVYVDETRPLLQGARLTAWELLNAGIDTTLICDNMAASLMQSGKVDKIFVGADRITRSGDTANKIGTYNLAILAHHHKVPFYVVAPVSTFDFELRSGSGIPIEERNGNEVKSILGRLVAPKKVKAYNPAFDVTPNRYITAIITEEGIFRKPYIRSLKRLKAKARR